MSVRILIAGRVQGVGFRFFCKGLAKKLAINGSVRNLESGEVEVIASGENLEKFINKLREGTFLSDIKQFDVQELPQDQEDIEGFHVLR